MLHGRVKDTKMALTRLERIVEARTLPEYELYTEGRGRRNADESLRAARLFRFGRGPRKEGG